MAWFRFRNVIVLMTGMLMSHPLFCGELVPIPDTFETPPLELPDLAGKSHNLDDYRNKVVLVNFWASWCGPCLLEMPSMQRLHEKMVDRPFSILAVDVEESKSTVWRFGDLLKIKFTTLLDIEGEASTAWGVEILPTSFLLDAEGRIRYGVQGALEWDGKEALQVIETLMPDHAAAKQAAADNQVRP